jgi:hypothetical protein
MASTYYHSLAVGVVDRDKLHRVDLERMRLAAEDQTNILCDAVGKAFFRPGTEHFAETKDGAKAKLIEFDAGGQAVYGLELTPGFLRVWDDDALVTRPAVTTTITNGDFNSGTGWTLGTTAGTTVQVTGGALKLQAQARGGVRAYAKQAVNPGGNAGLEHGLRITVFRGPVQFRVGSSDGGQEYIKETTLRTGYHSLAFIPSGVFYVEFSSTRQHAVYVNDINVEAAGAMSLPTIWDVDELELLRTDQSLDVMFIACEGRKQQRVESRGDNSWSVCDYDADDGPFLVSRSAEVKLKPTVLEGTGLLQSDIPYFSADHVGTLVRIYHDGQQVSTVLASDDSYTPTIMVTGINEPEYNERDFFYTVSGTWAGTLRWQRSFDGDDIEFHRFRKAQGTADTDITGNVAGIINDDNEDNAISYYRLGFEPGAYTSGAATVAITYNGGGGYGIARIVGFNSSTEVVIVVLKPFMDTTFSENWREGYWSEVNGWPSAVIIDDGRLNWGGYDAFWGSVSDAYDSFDEDFVGDAGPLLRSIAVGGRNETRWLAGLSTLMIGTGRLIASARASSLDEIKTPENFGIRRQGGKVGAARVDVAVLADDRALFVEASGNALYELNYSSEKGRFLATEFSKLTTEVFLTGITQIVVQNRPDQRIWVVLESGDAVCIVFEPGQLVSGFIPISLSSATDAIESLCILPTDTGQERVLASIKRVVNGVTSRRIERLALDTEAKPADITKCLDSHVVFGAGSATINLPHLVGRTVRVWMDGDSVDNVDGTARDFVVSGGGTITLPSVPTIGGCAGLPYRGRYKSAKVEYGVPGSTSMLRPKTISAVGLLLADYCRSGVKYGPSFSKLFNLPSSRNGVPVTSDVITGVEEQLEPSLPMDGPITLDTRVCIELNSPKPATLLALVMEYEARG